MYFIGYTILKATPYIVFSQYTEYKGQCLMAIFHLGHTKHRIGRIDCFSCIAAVNRCLNLDCLPHSALYLLANYNN